MTTPRGAGLPGSPTQRLYWGDLHRHSNVSRCGAGLDIAAEDHYRFADDLLGCDFWALTDHAENTSDLNWHHLKKLANAFYRPGSHACLIGFEWTSFLYGHYNVIYAGDDGPVLSSVDVAADDPAKLWQQLDGDPAGQGALTIPHHPASWVYPTDWSFRSDRYLRLVEVFQACTGSYESPWCHRQYHDALAPGSSVVDGAAWPGTGWGSSVAPTTATALPTWACTPTGSTGPRVMQALTERRCFAATRRGIVPELSIGDAVLGQEISPRYGRAAVDQLGGQGIAELAVVQLVRDGVVVASSRGRRPRCGSWRVEAAPARRPGTRHGGRPPSPDRHPARRGCGDPGRDSVVPARGERGRHPNAVVVGVAAAAVRQAAPAAGGAHPGGDGPRRAGRRVRIEAGGARLQASLADLADGRTVTSDDVDAAGCDIQVRAGIGGLTGLGTRRWRAQAPAALLRAGSWYYVRIIQVDGEAAWSSPIWVDP